MIRSVLGLVINHYSFWIYSRGREGKSYSSRQPEEHIHDCYPTICYKEGIKGQDWMKMCLKGDSKFSEALMWHHTHCSSGQLPAAQLQFINSNLPSPQTTRWKTKRELLRTLSFADTEPFKRKLKKLKLVQTPKTFWRSGTRTTYYTQ